jgi:putative DNA-invertase from lambdoid prophage Rac
MEVNKVVLYARVSKLNGYQDPEVQLSALRAFCSARSWTVMHEYVDHGYSGSKTKRPALDKLMTAARTGSLDFDAVLVWKIDRFGRSVQHLCNAVTELDEAGIAFISMTDNLDMSSPTGRLMFHMLSAMAEFERALIQERIKSGLRHARAKGHIPGPKIGAEGPSRSTLWRRARSSSTHTDVRTATTRMNID